MPSGSTSSGISATPRTPRLTAIQPEPCATIFGHSCKTLMVTRQGGLPPISVEEALHDCDYFFVMVSAHWCPPCRTFLPILRTFYDRFHEKKKFQVFYFSRDATEQEKETFFAQSHGPWCSFPLEFCNETYEAVSQAFHMLGFPKLLVFKNVALRNQAKNQRRVILKPAGSTPAAPTHHSLYPHPSLHGRSQSTFSLAKDPDVVSSVNLSRCFTDGEGEPEFIGKSGRPMITQDPEGLAYPWPNMDKDVEGGAWCC